MLLAHPAVLRNLIELCDALRILRAEFGGPESSELTSRET